MTITNTAKAKQAQLATVVLSAPTFARPEMKNPGFVTCSKAGRGVARGLRLHYSADALGWYEFLGLFAGRGFYRWN